MNTIHIVNKRPANILNNLKQKDFLGKIRTIALPIVHAPLLSGLFSYPIRLTFATHSILLRSITHKCLVYQEDNEDRSNH